METTTNTNNANIANPASGKPLYRQEIAGRVIYTSKSKRTGLRFAHISLAGSSRETTVPAQLCELAAGKDAWMKEITFKCDGCNNRTKAGELQAGYCSACVTEAEEENARLDAGQ